MTPCWSHSPRASTTWSHPLTRQTPSTCSRCTLGKQSTNLGQTHQSPMYTVGIFLQHPIPHHEVPWPPNSSWQSQADEGDGGEGGSSGRIQSSGGVWSCIRRKFFIPVYLHSGLLHRALQVRDRRGIFRHFQHLPRAQRPHPAGGHRDGPVCCRHRHHNYRHGVGGALPLGLSTDPETN